MFSIQFIDETTSTNDAVKEINEHNIIIATHKQTKGRGQRGNSWESEQGKNLTFSVVIKPSFLPFAEQFYISKIVSNALILTLKKFAINAKVKWPNDIYVGGEKICGILIENNVSSSGDILSSIIGVGLNVNQTIFVSDALNPTSMGLITGKDYVLEEILATFAKMLGLQYKTLEAGFQREIDTFYFNNLYLLNEWAPYKEGDNVFKGKIVNVKPSGELIIERENGETSSFIFKEVEYIINF